MPQSDFEGATRFVADLGPFLAYYIVGAFTVKDDACWCAAGVGLLGSAMEFANSRMNPGRPWPRLLNTAEMFTYAGMAILFLQDKHCKMWANFLQLCGITLALAGGMFTRSHAFVDDILRGGAEDLSPAAAANLKSAARELAWAIIAAFVAMTVLCLVPPVYRVAHDEPMSNSGRVWLDWVGPVTALFLAVGYISATAGPKLSQAKAAAAAEGGGVSREGRALLAGGELAGGEGGEESGEGAESDPPAVFAALLVLSLVPVVTIAGLTADNSEKEVCW